MTADEIIQELGGKIYARPLSLVRDEPSYPDLANPLHLIILLVDCDTEVMMNGMLGFLENMTGRTADTARESSEGDRDREARRHSCAYPKPYPPYQLLAIH